ncbi:MAG TPA: hypothetical protein VLZ75_11785 [Chitinophagales bacterium]|nr:hypothetical protein [Chitinophagales bacterium]
MNEDQLESELKNWAREDLIAWLSWNDPNGVYNDSQSLLEFDNIMSYEEGVSIIMNQILER